MTEPCCDMPWEIYLDWLEDQGYSDLREVEIGAIFTPCCMTPWEIETRDYINPNNVSGQGATQGIGAITIRGSRYSIRTFYTGNGGTFFNDPHNSTGCPNNWFKGTVLRGGSGDTYGPTGDGYI